MTRQQQDHLWDKGVNAAAAGTPLDEAIENLEEIRDGKNSHIRERIIRFFEMGYSEGKNIRKSIEAQKDRAG